MSVSTTAIFRFRVSLQGIEPLIWREFEILATSSFEDLHYVVQSTLGRNDMFEHRFIMGNEVIRDVEYISPTDDKDECITLLNEFFEKPGATCIYEYGVDDLNTADPWGHTVELLAIEESQEGIYYPRCTAGQNATPPEDCEGVTDYQNLLAILADPTHADHEEVVELYENFDPKAFNLAGVNEMIKTVFEEYEKMLDDLDEDPEDFDDIDYRLDEADEIQSEASDINPTELFEWIGIVAEAFAPLTPEEVLELGEFVNGITEDEIELLNLHGMLTASVVAPKSLDASDVLKLVLKFADKSSARKKLDRAQADRITELLAAVQSRMVMDIHNNQFKPLVHMPKSGEAPGDWTSRVLPWCYGFLTVVETYKKQWNSVLSHPDLPPRIRPLIAIGLKQIAEKEFDEDFVDFPEDLSEWPEEVDNEKSFLEYARGLPGECMKYWKERKTQNDSIRSAKISRNDPCPCGSGNKYKRCCGKN
jgi:yecA family protein